MVNIRKGFKLTPTDKDKRIAELEQENKVLAQNLEDTEILNKTYEKRFSDLEKENAELRKVAEFQQSSNMETHLENKKLKEGLAVGSTFNKTLNSMNKALEEERDKYRNIVFDKDEQLTKAKELIENLIRVTWGEGWNYSLDWKVKAEQFIKE